MITSILRRIPILSWFAHSHLINIGLTYGYIKVFRMAHIAGRYGGYKTALAFRIAFKLWEDGRVENIYSNIGSPFNDDIEQFADAPDPRDLRACLVFDEAGQFFNTRKDVTEVIAFLRKMKLIFLMPSVEPPTTRVTRLTIEPYYNLTIIGVPLVIYRTILMGRRRSDDKTSYFAWWRPSEIFGCYDTEDAPVTAGGLDHSVIELKDRMAKRVDKGSRYYLAEQRKQQRKSGSSLLPIEFIPAAQTDYEDEFQPLVYGAPPPDELAAAMTRFEDMNDRFEELADTFAERLERSTEDVNDKKKPPSGVFS